LGGPPEKRGTKFREGEKKGEKGTTGWCEGFFLFVSGDQKKTRVFDRRKKTYVTQKSEKTGRGKGLWPGFPTR